MTAKVFALATKPGVQRDGTVFDMNFYTDARWVRFQRGRPRKMAGYAVMSNQMTGPSRGIWVNPQDSFTAVFSGYSAGLQKLSIDNNGVGAGVTNFSLSNFTSSVNNLWQFDGFYDVAGAGVATILAHPGQNLAAIDSTANTPVLSGNIDGSTLSQIGTFTDSNAYLNGTTTVTLSQADLLIGAGQAVSGTGIPSGTTVVSKVDSADILSTVAVTGTGGQISCASTSGLFIGQTVSVSGTTSPQTLSSVTITSENGDFSCTATTGLYVNQPVYVTGTQVSTTLGSVQVTGTAGQCSCTTVSGLYVGQAVVVTGTLTGTATGISSGVTYYIKETNVTASNSTFTLSATPGGTALVTTAGTTTGLVFKVRQLTGVTSGSTYYITATATGATSTFTLSSSVGGPPISTQINSVSGLVFSVPKDTGLTSGSTYYIIATNYSTTFTLSATRGGSAITTIVNSTTGLVFTLGLYTKVVLSAAATTSGNSTLTFNNNVSVSGGVVSLHPYVFVYGNNGFIKNCAAGNAQDWVSADANEVNVATGKIVQGLPVRGGSNAPSGLFWSLDSLIRVSYIGGTGTPAQYWRYDIITSQTSILSSQSAIEYDGVYYWCAVDRFMLYNGTVKEIPNNFNQNYFFDNLNYSQRQKVWACKVPRFGEIWWFYPRGEATECTDAVIYNIRENAWYDAGEALGARRSAGYFSQVFSRPIAAGWDVTSSEVVFTQSMTTTNGKTTIPLTAYNTSVEIGQVISGTNVLSGTTVASVTSSGLQTLGSITGGSSYTNGTYSGVTLTGGSGLGATANITVSGGAVTAVTIVAYGAGYRVGDALSAAAASIGGTGAGFSVPVTAIYAQIITMSAAAYGTGTQTLTFSTAANLFNLYQHELGVDAVDGQNVNAIESYFETNDLGWVSGGPSDPMLVGENKWARLERVEPDFIQSGQMYLQVTGRPYAQSEDVTSAPYFFEPDTNKIDMKEQRRELRLRFTSNVVGGNFQLGKLLLSATIGDVRGY